MNFEKLKNNVQNVMIEQQIKLGYRKGDIYLYYPLQSLNRLLCVNDTVSDMIIHLSDFAESIKDELGQIEVSHVKDRFCLHVPAKGSEYVYHLSFQYTFLKEFISVIESHNCTIDDIVRVFQKYSNHVHFQKVKNGDFDYLLYFIDGEPDSFRYCITDEGCHMIYHRFTKEDYEDFNF